MPLMLGNAASAFFFLAGFSLSQLDQVHCVPAGDATANLMWRLQNGEIPKGLKAGVVVVHIGSSDLTYASFQVGRSVHENVSVPGLTAITCEQCRQEDCKLLCVASTHPLN